MRRLNVAAIVFPLLVVAAATALIYVALRSGNLTGPRNGDDGDQPLPYITAPGYVFPHTIRWIDDSSILYLGGSAEDYFDLYTKREFSVRIWNSRTGKVEDIDRAAREELCFDGKVIRYPIQVGETLVYREGPLGATRAVSRGSKQDRDALARQFGQHPFHCKTYSLASLGPEAQCRLPLRDGDGLLDTTGRQCREAEVNERKRLLVLDRANRPGEPSRTFIYDQELKSRPVQYFEHPAAEPIDLPIAAREVGIGYGMHYSVFGDAYVISARDTPQFNPTGTWPTGVPVPVYLIRRGGRVTRLDVPWDDRWSGRPADAQYVRSGLILRITAVRRASGGRAGLYLQPPNGRARRLFAGYSEEMRVSPDGCRVAFHEAYTPKDGFPKNVRGLLHLIDLC